MSTTVELLAANERYERLRAAVEELGVRVDSAHCCNVGPRVNSQWRNLPHYHAVWPDGQSWCYPSQADALERALEVITLRLHAIAPRPADHSGDVPPHTHGGTDAPECTTCSP